MSVREKCIKFIHNKAVGSKGTRAFYTLLGASLFLLLFVIFIAASLIVDKFFKFPGLLPLRFNIIISLPFLFFGLFFEFWSVSEFFRTGGTPVPLNPPPILVTGGPYAYVRNPMLTGVFLLLFGIGFLLRSVSLVFILTPLFILLNLTYLKTIEEPELEKRLGNAYIEYKKRVPMFFPSLKRKIKK